MEEPATNSPREAIAGGLIGLLKPAVEELDERVLAVRCVHLIVGQMYTEPGQNSKQSKL